MFAALCFSITCFAGASYNDSTGMLTIPEVAVDGTTVIYGDVKLQMDMMQGTFVIQSAIEKNIKFPEAPLQTRIVDGSLEIKFFGCKRSGSSQIICMERYFNSTQDVRINIFGDKNNAVNFYKNYDVNVRPVPDFLTEELNKGYSPSYAIDNLGNEYSPTSITTRGKSDISLINFPLLKDKEIEVRYAYNNIHPDAASLSLFSPLVISRQNDESTTAIFENYKNINF